MLKLDSCQHISLYDHLKGDENDLVSMKFQKLQIFSRAVGLSEYTEIGHYCERGKQSSYSGFVHDTSPAT